MKLPITKYKIYLKNGKIQSYLNLINILDKFSLQNNIDISTVLSNGLDLFKNYFVLHENENNESYQFFIEQLELIAKSPVKRKYSINLTIKSFEMYFKSSSLYSYVRSFLCLPSIQFLRRLSSKLNTNEYIHYLKTKAKYIDNKEKIVILQLDEVQRKS